MRGRIGRYYVVPTFVGDLLSLTTTTNTTPDNDGYDNDDDNKPAEASGTKNIRRARGAGTTVPMDDPDLLSRLRIATTTTDDSYNDDSDRLERDGGSLLLSFYSALRDSIARAQLCLLYIYNIN